MEYLNDILANNNIGIKYEGIVLFDELNSLNKKYDIYYLSKINRNEYSNEEIDIYYKKLSKHFYIDGVIHRPFYKDNLIIDEIILIKKDERNDENE